jgi:hypothetical protein
MNHDEYDVLKFDSNSCIDINDDYGIYVYIYVYIYIYVLIYICIYIYTYIYINLHMYNHDECDALESDSAYCVDISDYGYDLGMFITYFYIAEFLEKYTVLIQPFG